MIVIRPGAWKPGFSRHPHAHSEPHLQNETLATGVSKGGPSLLRMQSPRPTPGTESAFNQIPR